METLTSAPTTPAVPDVRIIPLDQIKASTHQARKDFDEEGIRGLAESLKIEGLMQAITVRESGDGTFELIAGERRVRAARLLGWPAIEAKVIRTISEAEAAVKGLVENLQRENLNPIEEAAGFQEISQLDPDHWTQGRIGQVSGRTQGYVSLSFKLLELPEVVQQSIRRRILSRSHALEIMRLPKDLQIAAAQKATDLSQKETRQLVENLLNKPSDPAKANNEGQPKPAGPDPLAAVWSQMASNTGLKDLKWKSRYHGEGEWAFTVTVPAETPGPDLARWFRLMQSALMEGIAQTDGRDTLDSLIPKTRKELEQAVGDLSQISLPEGSSAEARLRENASALGPEEVFKRLFGKGSFYHQKVEGKTWEDLGCSDPDVAVQKLLDGLRKIVAK